MPNFRYAYVVKYQDNKGGKYQEEPTLRAEMAIETAKSFVELGKRNVNISVTKVNYVVKGYSTHRHNF